MERDLASNNDNDKDTDATKPQREKAVAPVVNQADLNLAMDQSRMDGGTDAWLAVVGCWILIFNSWGLSNAYGVFQTYYSTKIIPDVSTVSISWIGSVQSFLTGFTGVFGGWLIDGGRYKEVILSATSFEVLGMMMTSIGTKYWHFLLSQGVCVGFGSGLLAVTSPAILATYFEKRRLLSGGIASTGGGVAGVILPIIMQTLFDKIGFGWAVRILGFTMLVLLLMAYWIIRPRTLKKRFIPLQPRWLKEPVYMLFVLAFAFVNAALYVPSFYIQKYALALGIDRKTSFYLLSILNAATTLSRILPNWLGDIYGAINVLIPCTLGTAIVAFLWREAYTVAGLVGISIGWSLVSGALISLPPLGIANLTRNPAEYGTRIGLGYTISAFGALVGNPIAGATLTRLNIFSGVGGVQNQYQGIWFVAAVSATIATLLLLVTRHLLVGFKLTVKI